MELSELVDRLVVAAEEQDCLYVLVWLEDLKTAGCLEEGINKQHSWKGITALEAIGRSEFNTIPRFIFQILLLCGAQADSDKPLYLARGEPGQLNERAMKFLERWEEQVMYTKLLLALNLETASDWIDALLPTPPNPDWLTGDGPLPSPISTAAASPRISLSDGMTEVVGGRDPQIGTPSRPRLFFSHAAQAYWTPAEIPPGFRYVKGRAGKRAKLVRGDDYAEYSHLYPKPKWSNWTEDPSLALDPVWLGLARFPKSIDSGELRRMFQDNGVLCKIQLFNNASSETFAFVTVGSDKVERCIKCFDEIKLEGRVVRCFVLHGLLSDQLPPEVAALSSAEGMEPPPSSSTPVQSSAAPAEDSSTSISPCNPSAPAALEASSNMVLVVGLPLDFQRSYLGGVGMGFQDLFLLRIPERTCTIAVLAFGTDVQAHDFSQHLNVKRDFFGFKPVLALLTGPETVQEEIESWFEWQDLKRKSNVVEKAADSFRPPPSSTLLSSVPPRNDLFSGNKANSDCRKRQKSHHTS